MAGRRQRQLKAMVKKDKSERQWDKILRDLGSKGKGGLKGTSVRGSRGRSGEDIRHNTAYRVLMGSTFDEGSESYIDPDGYWSAELDAVRRCMKKKLMRGKSITSAYVGCGMGYDKGGSGSKADLKGRGGDRRYYGANFENMDDPDLVFSQSQTRQSRTGGGKTVDDWVRDRLEQDVQKGDPIAQMRLAQLDDQIMAKRRDKKAERERKQRNEVLDRVASKLKERTNG